MSSSQVSPVSQSGMALLIVLWVVAGLSLFAASLGRTVRSEAGQASVARYLVEGRAYGEAAINLTLAQIRSPANLPVAYTAQTQEWNGVAMTVEIVPASGLVNLLSASDAVWSMLFEKAAGLPRNQAEQLAQALIMLRTLRQQQSTPWESMEDVLQVPGMNYFIFQAIRPYVVVQSGGDGSVSLQAAPEPLRSWLQASGMGGGDKSTNFFRITANVPFYPEGEVLVERQVSLRDDQRLGAPWRVLSAEQRWLAMR